MRLSTLYSSGNFYKGNLHCHSTHSDGMLTPAQLKEEYQKRGYSFIMFADHNINTNFIELNSEGFIALQGFEGQLRQSQTHTHKEFHILCLKTPDSRLQNDKKFKGYGNLMPVAVPQYTGDKSLLDYIQTQRSRGYMIVFNHPYWSFNDIHDLEVVKDEVLGIEIYNHGCEISENTGHSEALYDLMLRKGNRLYCFACDDNHNLDPMDSAGCDSFGGFVVVKAKSLDEESILEAVYDGSFYASSGPAIEDFYVEDGQIVVKCSAASRVYISNQNRNYRMAYNNDSRLTCHCAKITEEDLYVRAEVVDSNGKKAYANPIWLK